MKTKKIAFLFLMFLGSFSVYAKDKQMEKEMTAPKGAWKIVVKNNLSAVKNDALIDSIIDVNDFMVQSKDPQLNLIRASNKNNFKKKIVTYLYNIIVIDNSITISGKFSTDISVGPKYNAKSEATFSKISNRGIKGAIHHETFSKLQSFAHLLGHNLEYITN